MRQSEVINLASTNNCESWFYDGELNISIGPITITLDKKQALELFILLENSNDKINELGLKLEDWN